MCGGEETWECELGQRGGNKYGWLANGRGATDMSDGMISYVADSEPPFEFRSLRGSPLAAARRPYISEDSLQPACWCVAVCRMRAVSVVSHGRFCTAQSQY